MGIGKGARDLCFCSEVATLAQSLINFVQDGFVPSPDSQITMRKTHASFCTSMHQHHTSQEVAGALAAEAFCQQGNPAEHLPFACLLCGNTPPICVTILLRESTSGSGFWQQDLCQNHSGHQKWIKTIKIRTRKDSHGGGLELWVS